MWHFTVGFLVAALQCTGPGYNWFLDGQEKIKVDLTTFCSSRGFVGLFESDGENWYLGQLGRSNLHYRRVL